MDIIEEELEILTGFDKEMRESALPIWFESLVGVDWALLHLAPVYYGLGVQKGDGSAVVVVPGFLGSDIYLYELYFWLRRIGYTPYLSNIGWNADCLDTLSEKLVETIRKARKETGRMVHLIGHSLGGVLSRSAAIQHPELVSSVITLASPFRGVHSHPRVLELSNRIRNRIFQKKRERGFSPLLHRPLRLCCRQSAAKFFAPADQTDRGFYKNGRNRQLAKLRLAIFRE